MKEFLLVITVGCLTLSQAQDCPKECSCTESLSSTARCNHLHSEMLFPERVKHLVIESLPDLQINLTKKLFTTVGLHHVLSIKIANCSISYIDYEAFVNLPELTDVVLSDNGLILIHPDTFESNDRLQRLTLSGNPLQLTQLLEGEENYFLKSSSLVELELSRCQLSDIGRKLLSQVPNLEYVNLSSNNIVLIDDTIFGKVPLLDVIDLSNNRLIAVRDIFEDVDELTVLNLHNNLIVNIDELDLPGLKELDLSNNKIKILRKNTLEGLTDLSVLNMSHNEITWLSEETFKDLKDLKHLDLSDNALIGPLPKFIFEDNDLLETLKLGGNKDIHIFEGFSTELPKLYLLDISACGLTSITNTSFTEMPNLAILNVSMNSINTLNHAAMSKLHRLNVLDLSSNDMTKLGTYTFTSNSHLRKLFLSKNRLHHLLPEVFEPTTILSYLDLSFNEFTHLWNLNESEYMKRNLILSQLQYLNLAGNDIKELHKTHFVHLKSLKGLDVQGNPLQCTAEFPLFIEWLCSRRISRLHNDGKYIQEMFTLEKANIQWDDLLMDVCHPRNEKIDINASKLNDDKVDEDNDHNLKIFEYTVIQDVKLDHPKEMTEEDNKLAEEMDTYVWPTFLVVFSLVFLTLAVGNTVSLLIYRHRNQTAGYPFGRTVVKMDPTPRYHKLYEECSVPKTPIVKGNLLENLVFSHIRGAKTKPDEVV